MEYIPKVLENNLVSFILSFICFVHAHIFTSIDIEKTRIKEQQGSIFDHFRSNNCAKK